MTKVQFEQEIDDRVFQSICLKSLSKIKGITLIEGNILETLFKGPYQEIARGITVMKEEEGLKVKIEVNIDYGVFLPDKAKEIQEKLLHALEKLTGLKVQLISVIFKNVNLEEPEEKKTKDLEDANVEEIKHDS